MKALARLAQLAAVAAAAAAAIAALLRLFSGPKHASAPRRSLGAAAPTAPPAPAAAEAATSEATPPAPAPPADQDAAERDDLEALWEEILATAEGRSATPPPPEPPRDALAAVLEEAAETMPRYGGAVPRRSAASYLDEGNIYFNVGQYAMAIDRYSRALELDPENAAADYNRANARA
ncbi:MAG: tetratricopeptide repeat protein, partial [Chloroflexota bacterium]|nr:tetratricopeptide repeat protein [Chloroflexota bacterium]